MQQPRPFGNRSDVVVGARQVAAWADAIATQLEKKTFTREDGAKVLAEICSVCSTTTLDYDSARQMAWAFIIVDRELRSKRQQVDDLFALLGSDEALGNLFDVYAGDDPIAGALRGLEDDVLLLNLRRGRKIQRQLPDEPQARTLLEVDLSKILPPISEYDPEVFKSRFVEIRELLP